MGVFTLPVLGAIGNLAGGILNRSSAKSQAIKDQQYNDRIRGEDRDMYAWDREELRRYAEKQTVKDRRYAESQRDNERNYARDVLVDDRVYDRKLQLADRQYERNLAEKNLKNDREYLRQKQDAQRRYDDKLYQEDIAQYKKDRGLMQDKANTLAEKSAASRGIDFVKLRDDAVKAGYNPMTALSMAHAYSTNVDYAVQGGVYSPRANYQTDNLGYSPTSTTTGAGARSGGGGGGAPAGAVMPSSMPAAGNFSSPGSGYSKGFEPALSAGTFVQDAVNRAVDLWSNRPEQRDPLADALRNAFQQDQMADEVRNSQIPGDFGYSLTKQQAFQPEATVGVPAFASAKAAPTSAKMPSGFVEKGGRKYVPVTLPDGSQSSLEASVARRYDIEPFDALSAGDWEEIRGGVVGEFENTVNADQNYDLMTGGNFWPVPPSAGDYAKSGRTGQQMFNSWPSN